MSRALELAGLGAGNVSPNPMVGCVIVHEGRIIGEGWHRKYGEAHAEVNAVNSVENKSLLSESEVYVTLEPCSHFGKTPPCADLLVYHQVKRVIICNVDSNPLVGGKGIEKLKNAGIEVITGILEEEGRILNRRFFTYIEKKRPFVILKWAESQDGFIAKPGFEAVQISNPLSKRLVHKMRSEEDAIMVGTNTARYDNPQLNVRNWTGRNPLRVVIDNKLELSEDLFLFDDSQPTICYNQLKDGTEKETIFVKIPEKETLLFILNDLFQRKIQSLIVEGGARLLQSFADERLWDEVYLIKGDNFLTEGIKAPILLNAESSLYQCEQIGNDKWFRYRSDF